MQVTCCPSPKMSTCARGDGEDPVKAVERVLSGAVHKVLTQLTRTRRAAKRNQTFSLVEQSSDEHEDEDLPIPKKQKMSRLADSMSLTD